MQCQVVHQKVDRTQALAQEEKRRQEEERVQQRVGEREFGTIYKEEESSVVAGQSWLWPSGTSRSALVQSLCHQTNQHDVCLPLHSFRTLEYGENPMKKSVKFTHHRFMVACSWVLVHSGQKNGHHF
jgi:hypothetical protein